MNTEILTLIIRLAVAFAVSIVFPALKKWIEQKTENEKFAQLADIAETAVAAAEQLYHATDPDGEVRRQYAHHLIAVAAGRLGLALTDKEIDSMLQAAVQELNLMKYGYIAEAKEDGES